MKLRYFIGGIVVTCTLLGILSIFKKNTPVNLAFPPGLNDTSSENNIGTFSYPIDNKISYQNEFLGFRFYFPSDWHPGINTLGDVSNHGYLQLLNYEMTQFTSGSVFPKGFNKIEIVTTTDSTLSSSSDYIEKERTTKKILIANKEGLKIDIVLEDHQSSRFYVFPLKKPELFLRMGIYGDPNNFYILDEIIKTIEWLN